MIDLFSILFTVSIISGGGHAHNHEHEHAHAHDEDTIDVPRQQKSNSGITTY